MPRRPRRNHLAAFKAKVADGVIWGYADSPFSQTRVEPLFHPDGTSFPPSEVRLLVPCEPTKVVGIGLNYHAHVEEKSFKVPEVPILFIKPTIPAPRAFRGDPLCTES
jgi:2-keto-4-pentenoate hydratase/2-oxohepta-3-ene-1,7-dioic acid hydratase in catechol pathway